MSLPELCQFDGCSQARGRHSVFCDDHHREQLFRAGLLSETPFDTCGHIEKRCRQVVKAHESLTISEEEMYGQLFEILIHGGTQGLRKCWKQAIGPLSDAIIMGLRAYVLEHPERRLWHPLPDTKAARLEKKRATRIVRAELVDELDARLRLK